MVTPCLDFRTRRLIETEEGTSAMTFAPFDFTRLFAPGLPPAAARWNGRVKFDFTGGNNDPDRLPLEGLIAAAGSVLRREGRKLAIYGVDNGPQGYRPLRDFLVGKLKADAGITCTADDIVLTSGSNHGLDLVNATFLTRGDTVIIEEDCYQSAINRFNRIGATVVGIPLDKHGMRMDALSNALGDLKHKGITPKYIYTIPTVQNPTATVLPMERRQEMLELAHSHGVPIFEDDCYAERRHPCRLVLEDHCPRATRGVRRRAVGRDVARASAQD
jgi:2-aminoadipate transaminase